MEKNTMNTPINNTEATTTLDTNKDQVVGTTTSTVDTNASTPTPKENPQENQAKIEEVKKGIWAKVFGKKEKAKIENLSEINDIAKIKQDSENDIKGLFVISQSETAVVGNINRNSSYEDMISKYNLGAEAQKLAERLTEIKKAMKNLDVGPENRKLNDERREKMQEFALEIRKAADERIGQLTKQVA
jgi:hypothetical protein